MPFDDTDKKDQIKQMKKGPSFDRTKQKLSEPLRQLILHMLDTDAKTRITLDQIESSEWCSMEASGKLENSDRNSF